MADNQTIATKEEVIYQVTCEEYSDWHIVVNLVGPDGMREKAEEIFQRLRPKYANKEVSRYRDDERGFLREFVAELKALGLREVPATELHVASYGTLDSTLGVESDG